MLRAALTYQFLSNSKCDHSGFANSKCESFTIYYTVAGFCDIKLDLFFSKVILERDCNKPICPIVETSPETRHDTCKSWQFAFLQIWWLSILPLAAIQFPWFTQAFPRFIKSHGGTIWTGWPVKPLCSCYFWLVTGWLNDVLLNIVGL